MNKIAPLGIKKPVAPMYCAHRHQLFVQSERWCGEGDRGRAQVMVCRDCGRFFVSANHNGEWIDIQFELPTQELVDAAGKFVQYVESAAPGATETEKG